MSKLIHLGLSGRYKIAVVDSRTQRVLWEQPEWQTNLILNDGFERIATHLICDCFTTAYAGTGSRTNNVASGVDTATCDTSGNMVINGGSTFLLDTSVPGDLQNTIKWDNTGFEGRITSIATTRTCVVSPVPGVSQSGTFVLYRTGQVGLQTEIVRTQNYLSVAPACSSFILGNILTHQRTWDFPAEIGTVTYQEFGVGWSTTPNAANTTFARFLLHSPVAVTATQQLRVVYQLREVLSPSTPFSKTAVISGWPVAPSTLLSGQEQIQFLGMSSVVASGATSSFDAGVTCNEPSVTANVQIFLATLSTALASLGSSVDRSSGEAVKGVSSPAYVAFSGSVTKQATFQTNEGNGTAWMAMGIGYDTGAMNPAARTGLCFLFDQAQTKTTGKTLNLQFFYNWSRVLN